MKIQIDKNNLRTLKPGKNYFQALTRSIIYQQLSTKAAESIYKRFIALFKPKRFPRPHDVLLMNDQSHRAVGLSRGKIVYIKDLAEKFIDGTINPKKIPNMSDEEIIEHVTRVKGIGVWSAHMFLIFTLNRPDVLPTGDLAIRKGFKRAFRLDHLPSNEEMEALATSHKGEKTALSLHLWSLSDL